MDVCVEVKKKNDYDKQNGVMNLEVPWVNTREKDRFINNELGRSRRRNL